MRLLEIAAADLGRGYLRGDGQHRHPRAVAVEQAVDEMQVAGSAASGTHREFTCQMRLGTGREGGDFFVPDMDPLDLALAAQRFGQPIQAVADDAIDPLDAGGGKGFGELVRDGLHGFTPSNGLTGAPYRRVSAKFLKVQENTSERDVPPQTDGCVAFAADNDRVGDAAPC